MDYDYNKLAQLLFVWHDEHFCLSGIYLVFEYLIYNMPCGAVECSGNNTCVATSLVEVAHVGDAFVYGIGVSVPSSAV